MNALVFYDQITVTNIEYSLKGIVRSQHSHFTCAFLHDSKWLYVDDLCNTVQSFLNTSNLYEYHQHGWFFAVYTQTSTFNNSENVIASLEKTIQQSKVTNFGNPTMTSETKLKTDKFGFMVLQNSKNRPRHNSM